jgi:hypothetical protein
VCSGIRSGLGIACDTSLIDPLLGCEIYLFSFPGKPLNYTGRDSCLALLNLRILSGLHAGEGWSLSRLQIQMPVAVAVSLLGSADAFGLGVCSVRELSIDVMALIICSPFWPRLFCSEFQKRTVLSYCLFSCCSEPVDSV